MCSVQSIQWQLEIKSNAEKFFDVWARKPYLASQMTPAKHPKIELHEGDWNTVGSIMTWNYALDDGERSFVRTRIVEIDEKSKSVSYDIIDGDVSKAFYKSFKPKVQAIPIGEGCIVNWTFEFEKIYEGAPEPIKYLDFLLDCAKDIDARLSIA